MRIEKKKTDWKRSKTNKGQRKKKREKTVLFRSKRQAQEQRGVTGTKIEIIMSGHSAALNEER